MSDIFISYASADRPQARKLALRLEQEGWSVWWDRKIPPGKSFAQVLESALNAAGCVVVLWSNTSRASDWVHNEAAEGKRKGILVPAFIEETSPPFEFRRIQAANLVGWQDELVGSELPQFLEAIRRALKDKGEYQPKADREDASHRASADASGTAVIRTSGWRTGASPWVHWARLALFAGLSGLTLMTGFRNLFPQTPITEALTAIAILSVILGAVLNYGWMRWRQMRAKK
ncbi:MAG: toll/interleukin-1 receptor domain-containing protein [Desulfobacterales bacterium]